MEGSDFLLTVAEISIAFDGFSAVVAVFRQGRGELLSPLQQLLLRVMIELGFAALFFSLAPFVLSYLDVAQGWLWPLCDVSLGAFMIIYFTHYGFRRRRYGALNESPVSARSIYSRIAVNHALGIIALLAGFDLILEPSLGIYALGITWLLALGALTFIIAVGVMERPGNEGLYK